MIVESDPLDTYTIYCDMDGVLVDFLGRFEEYTGLKWENVTKEEAWRIIKQIPNFWLHLNPMPDAGELWGYIRNYNTAILTSPSRSDWFRARTGKRAWTKRHLGRVPVVFRGGKKKSELAANDSILIDDFEPNIRRWREAGGIAILHTSAQKTIEELREIPPYSHQPGKK